LWGAIATTPTQQWKWSKETQRQIAQQKLRDRLLTLPAMMAVVVSLVYRRIPSLSEVLRVLEVEGLLWVEPLKVTKQALSIGKS
jgi:hypothetical protein